MPALHEVSETEGLLDLPVLDSPRQSGDCLRSEGPLEIHRKIELRIVFRAVLGRSGTDNRRCPECSISCVHGRGVPQALELANAACAGQQRGDRSGSGDCCGWWALQRGRCFLRLGMLRDAENQFRRAAEAGDPLPRAHLWLARVGVCSRACTDC